MKIRSGFVSNSSSSSFIVALPEDWDITDEEIESCNDSEEKIEDIRETFNQLKSKGKIYSEMEGFGCIESIMSKKKFVIEQIDGGPDEYPCLVNILSKAHQTKINKIKEI
jgi:hypothetical protein